MGEVEEVSNVASGNGMQSGSDTSETGKVSQERQNIVNRYVKGIGCDDESDILGDAEFTDQYGFVLKAEPSPVPKQEEDRRKQNEVKRRTKWLKMVRHWDKYCGTDKLHSRVYKGIPQSMRGDVWKLLLQVYQYMENMPAVYEEMKTRAHGHSTDIRQIDLDVNRTYRDHEMFRKRYSIKQRELFHVLAAYSMYNTEVGYCQGMSQIAALLLMYMSEEEAFWALHSLLYGERHKMHGFFIPGFPKLIRFQEHHDRVLKKLMPKLKRHLDENEVFASLYTMKWFFQCFLDRSPFSLTLRLWDIYVLEGEKLLVAMSYATLKYHKAYLKSQDMDGIVSFLQEQLVKDFGAHDDDIVEHLKSCMVELRRFRMDLPPKAHDMENPKLPFGAFIPNSDAGQAKVPEFARHAVDIEKLLPDFKRKGSVKAKREKVKRGKSSVEKTPVSNGAESVTKLPEIKEATAAKDQGRIRGSPLSRESDKIAKTKRKEPGKSPTATKPSPGNAESRDQVKRVVKTASPEANGNSSADAKQEETKSNGRLVFERQREKLKAGEALGKNVDSDSTVQTFSSHSTNSNNSKSHGKRSNPSQKHTDGPFYPTILGRVSSSSYDTPSTDGANYSPTSKVVPKWNIPSNGKSRTKDSFNTLQPKSGRRERDHGAAANHYHSQFSQTMARKKSQSSDLLKVTSGGTLKTKTLSFSQLSAALDTIDNASQASSPVVSTPSDTGSSLAQFTGRTPSVPRPMSYYDNVPMDGREKEDLGTDINEMAGVEPSRPTMPKSRGKRKKRTIGGANSRSTGDLQSTFGRTRPRKDGYHGARRRTREITDAKDADAALEDSRTSPFQRAVLENGILDPPVANLRSRRMSREEIVTAAVLSQLDANPQSGRNRKHARRITDDGSSMKKSKSAASLSQRFGPSERRGARKKSADAKLVLPLISTAKSDKSHSWNTVELDPAITNSRSLASHPDDLVRSNPGNLKYAPFPPPNVSVLNFATTSHHDSEINRLLSAGVNADSSMLRRYGMHSQLQTQVFAAPYNRRHSVTTAVQTEESRVS